MKNSLPTLNVSAILVNRKITSTRKFQKVNVKFRKFVSFSMLISIFVWGCDSKKEKAQHYINSANMYYAEKNFLAAEKAIDSAFLLDPLNLEIKFVQSKIYDGLDQYEKSIPILRSLEKQNYKLDSVYYFLAGGYFTKGLFYTYKKADPQTEKESLETSLRYFQLSIASNSRYFLSYRGKWMVLHNLKRYDEALITVNEALVLFPDSLDLIYSRGIEKIYLGDNWGALLDLNESINNAKLDSTDLAVAYRFRGNIYFDEDSFDLALADLSQAILQNPKDELAYLTRAEIFKQKGLKEEACADFRKSAELGYVAVYKEMNGYCDDY